MESIQKKHKAKITIWLSENPTKTSYWKIQANANGMKILKMDYWNINKGVILKK